MPTRSSEVRNLPQPTDPSLPGRQLDPQILILALSAASLQQRPSNGALSLETYRGLDPDLHSRPSTLLRQCTQQYEIRHNHPHITAFAVYPQEVWNWACSDPLKWQFEDAYNVAATTWTGSLHSATAFASLLRRTGTTQYGLRRSGRV